MTSSYRDECSASYFTSPLVSIRILFAVNRSNRFVRAESLYRLVEVPQDVQMDLMSGTSVSISWKAVEGASSYTVDVQPPPSLENDLVVSTDYAFIDGLLPLQEYSIRVSATVQGVQSAFSEALKVTPSGAPVIAPAPQVIAYDESSVTLNRRHMRHYANGDDLNKIIVLVKEGDETTHELEFPVSVRAKENP